MTVKVNTVGDKSWVMLSSIPDKRLWISSLGSHALLRTLIREDISIAEIPMIAGILSLCIALLFIHIETVGSKDFVMRRAMVCCYFSLPLFMTGLVEVTPIGMPLAILALGLAGAFANREIDSHSRALMTGIFAAAAVVMHGVYLVLLVMLGIKYLQRNFKLFRSYLAGTSITFTLIWLTMLLTKTKTVLGDADGGGDARIIPTDFLSVPHISRAAAILACGCAMFSLNLVLTNLNGSLKPKRHFFLYIGVAGVVAFTLIWNLDLGWPADYDLIAAVSVVLLWIPGFDSNSQLKTRHLLYFAGPLLAQSVAASSIWM